MKTTAIFCVGLLAGLSTLVSQAHASGALISPEQLPAADRAALRAEIDQARQRDPDAFDQVDLLRAQLPALDLHKRGRLVPLSLMLKGLGDRALLPLIERVAFSDPATTGLTPSARLAWRAGLVEALGNLRQPGAATIWRAILDGAESDPLVRRASVTAFAKLDNEEVAVELLSRAESVGPWQEALLTGMGYCRRPLIAQRLATALDTLPPATLARGIAKSLGDVGGGRSWRLIPARRTEGQEVREIAARALIGAAPHYDGGVRRMITKALLVVDHDDAERFIAAERQTATPSAFRTLDDLAARVAASPFRRRR